MNNPFKFFVELARQPLWIPLWVSVLMLVNFASVAFWSESTSKLILVTFMICSALMMGLYSRFGFTKILGLGHVLWIPLLIHALTRLPNTGGAFRGYLIGWCIFTVVSLAFDVVDVWKYWKARAALAAMKQTLSLAFRPSVVKRALKYAGVVGTILIAINHSDGLLDGELPPARLLRIALTGVVPYVVSTLSSVGAMQEARVSTRR